MFKWIIDLFTQGNVLSTFFICFTFIVVIIIITHKYNKFGAGKQGFLFESEDGKKIVIERRSIYQQKLEIKKALELEQQIQEIKENSFDTQYNIMKDYFKELKQKLLDIYRYTFSKLLESGKYECVEKFAKKNSYNYFSDMLGDVVFDNMYHLVKRIRGNGADKIHGDLWEKYKKQKFKTFMSDKKDQVYLRWKIDEMVISYDDFYKIANCEIEESCWKIINTMEEDLRQTQIDMHNIIDPMKAEIEKLKSVDLDTKIRGDMKN